MKHKTLPLKLLASLLFASLALAACDRAGEGAGPSSTATVAEPAVTESPTTVEASAQAEDDPYLWLEEIKGEKVDAWVDEQNAATVARLSADPRFESLKNQFRTIFESEDRLPDYSDQVQYRGQVYELHTDAEHPRGEIMRTSLESYISGAAFWEPLIDIDQFATDEGGNWYSSPMQMNFSPSGKTALVSFSDGGSDAVILREFDLENKRFVEGGFEAPLRRHFVKWLDEDTVLVATPLGESDRTLAFYPRHVRKWVRGTAIEDAPILSSVDEKSMMSIPMLFKTGTLRIPLLMKMESFVATEVFALAEDDSLVELDLPLGVLAAFGDITGVGDHAVVLLEQDWEVSGETFKSGSRVAVNMPQLIAQGGKADGTVSLVYEPAANESLSVMLGGFTASKDAVYLNVLTDVKSRIKRFQPQPDGAWAMTDIPLPGDGAAALPMGSDPYSESFLVRFENFLTPPSLMVLKSGTKLETVQQVKANTDLSQFVTEQFFATAKDGTKIPYFVTHAKDMKLDGSAPVLMYAYGGFGIPMTQSYELPYIGPTHEIWLQRGGVFVLANPRGGGEYGPVWHEAGRGVKRQTVYDDLYAISEDIIARGLSSPGKFGFIGGSNGGLTAGVLPTQRPDLFGASVVLVPLLDMARFHKLLAGASWMVEYGNPEDPVQGPPLLAYSPYQNVKPGQPYPEMFFLTSTQDDRVHPGHARKMAKKMMDMGYPALFYEAREGGHAMAVNNEGKAFNAAMGTVYLLQKLMN
jgi:prolyl oligopeptidase